MSRALRLWPGVPVELDVERRPDGAVRVLCDPCGPEVVIPPGLWERLLALTPAEVEQLRDAAGPWGPPA